MLSRVAESVYWMSRYSERAENVARFVDVNYSLSLGNVTPLAQQWAPLVYTTGDHEDFEERYDGATRENVLRFLLFDKENSNSILSCVSSARESARTVRAVLPAAVWEQINSFYLLVLGASKTQASINEPYEFCESVRMASHLMVGITHSSMRRDDAWNVLQTGRFIERADKTSRIVDVQYYLLLPKPEDVGSTIDIVRWSSLLKSADALQTYRRTNGRLIPSKVAEFLILDRKFPRSIRYCVDQARQYIENMAEPDDGEVLLPSLIAVNQLADRLKSVTIEEVIDQGLHDFIDHLQGALNGLGNSIYGDFFNTQAQQRRFADRTSQQRAMSQHQS